MRARQKQSIEAYQRVQAFLGAHPLIAPATYGMPQQTLDDVIVRLSDNSRAQVTGTNLKRAGVQNEQTLRDVLRDQQLRPLTAIARARLRGSPGIDKALYLPKPKLATTKLLAVADSFREAVAPYESVFVESGRPADFLAQLEAAREALYQAFLSKASHLGSQVGAGAAIDQEIVRGRDAVRMLDAIVRTSFAGNQEVLAEWRSASRIRGTPTRHRKTATGSTTGTVDTSSTGSNTNTSSSSSGTGTSTAIGDGSSTTPAAGSTGTGAAAPAGTSVTAPASASATQAA